MTRAPAPHHRHDAACGAALVHLRDAVQQLAHRLRVARQLRGERLRQRQHRACPRRGVHRRPPRRPCGQNTGAQERRLARARRADHGQQLSALQASPQRLDLLLAAEEDPRILFGEARQPRVGAALLDRLKTRRTRGSVEDRVERKREVVRRVEAVLARFLETPPHDPTQRRRHGAAERLQLGRCLIEDCRQRRDRRLARERVAARQQLVQHHTEREDVAPVIDRQPAHLLGGHVADRPDHLPCGRWRRFIGRGPAVRVPVGESRQAEVEDLDAALVGDEHVLGLDVAVDDALRVGGGEATRDLHREHQRLLLRRRPLAHRRAQRLAVQQLRDDVRDCADR